MTRTFAEAVPATARFAEPAAAPRPRQRANRDPADFAPAVFDLSRVAVYPPASPPRAAGTFDRLGVADTGLAAAASPLPHLERILAEPSNATARSFDRASSPARGARRTPEPAPPIGHSLDLAHVPAHRSREDAGPGALGADDDGVRLPGSRTVPGGAGLGRVVQRAAPVARAHDGSLEHQADAVGERIGADLGPAVLAEGPLSLEARAAAEQHLGPLPPISVRETSDSSLAPGALASAHGTRIQFRPGALSSKLPFYRVVLGHEIVHVAQQQFVGPRTQHRMIHGVKVPDATLRAEGTATILLLDGVPVLKTEGQLVVDTSYDKSGLRFGVLVRSSASVLQLQSLHFLNAMYPALEGRVVVNEPSLTLPKEGVPKKSTRSYLFGVFGRVPVVPSAPAHTAAATPGPAARTPGVKPAPTVGATPAATSASAAGSLLSKDKEANPYRTLDVPARAKKVKELLDKWWSGRDIVQVFQASGDDAEFLQLEKATDFGAVLDKLDDWSIVRLASAGPILPAYRARVNRARADYLERIVREWGGTQRAEIFALYVFDTTTNDDIEAVLKLLAGDQELYRTVSRMPVVLKRLRQRGSDITKFKDRGWKAADIGTGLYHAFDRIIATSPVVSESRGAAAMQERIDLPGPYRAAVRKLDTAALERVFTPRNVLLGVADQALLGLPSTVKGVVYDLPRSAASGVEELSKGHVEAGVERLAVPVVIVLAAALGIRGAFRRSRINALLELTAEGKALYKGLEYSIGESGLQRVGGYVRKSEAARILVAENGAEGILALDTAKGDVDAARALVAERKLFIDRAGASSTVSTRTPATAPPTDLSRTNEAPPLPQSVLPEAILPDGSRIKPDSYSGGYYGTSEIPPDLVVAEGLPARGNDWRILEHAEQRAPKDTAFRGVTALPLDTVGESGAAYWAGEGGWVYEIKGVPTWDVNKALEGRVATPGGFRGNLMHGENELVIPARVTPDHVVRWGVVVRTSTNRLRVLWGKQ